MRRIFLLLAVVAVMVALVATSAGTALAIPANACGGSFQAHTHIPLLSPGHEHVFECA